MSNHALRLHPIPLWGAVTLFVSMLTAALLAYALEPSMEQVSNPPNLEATVPQRFGEWESVPSPLIQAQLSIAGERSMDQPYDETVTRAYRNHRGDLIMLALAYGRNQRQEVKIHRPELCYPAQGFEVLSLAHTGFARMAQESRQVVGRHMVARSSTRTEAVSYWIRIGGVYSDSAWTTRGHIMTEGLQGRIPDGILVRASRSVVDEAEAAQAFPALDAFLTELVAATPEATRSLLVR